MIVRIKKTDKRLKLKEGELYKAYNWRGAGKVVLTSRIPDGFDPEVSQYHEEVEVVQE